MRKSKFEVEATRKNILFEKAAERLWEKLEFWTDDISLEEYDPVEDKFTGTWDRVASKNDILDFLVEEVEEEYSTELTQLQKDWAIYMFLYRSMAVYNEEFEKELEGKE
jgi:hypothetical protein